jgi:hypothetical protein
MQFHYQCIHFMPPTAERTSTAAGTEKEKRKMCRRARGGVRIWRKVDKRLEIVTNCGDRQVGFRVWSTCQVKNGKCCGFYCAVVRLLMITAGCSHWMERNTYTFRLARRSFAQASFSTRSPVGDGKMLFHVRSHETAFTFQLTDLNWDKLPSNEYIRDEL